MKFKCPGGHNTPCGQIVEGEIHKTEKHVAVLEDHPGCKRRYVKAYECLIDEGQTKTREELNKSKK